MTYDVLIIGSGASGMSTALYTARAGLKTAVIERGLAGGTLHDTEYIENYIGTGKVKASDLADSMYEQMLESGVEYIYGGVESIEQDDNDLLFDVYLRRKSYRAKVVVIATGVKHKKLNVVGEEKYHGSGISNCAICDGSFFREKHVAVIGGGDSAFEEGAYLANIASKVTLVYHKGLKDSRAQQYLKDRFMNLDNTSVVEYAKTNGFHGDTSLIGISYIDEVSLEMRGLSVDGAFVYVGVEPNSHLLRSYSQLLDSQGYIMTNINDLDIRMMTDWDGVFAVGDVTNESIRQVSTAVADGAIASKGILEYINSKF